MPADDLLYPPVELNPWWWALVAAFAVAAVLLLAAAVVVTRRRRRRTETGPTVESLRRETLSAIEAVLAEHAGSRATAPAACQELSRLVRSFVGRASAGDADFQTAEQLRLAALADHRLEPTARFTADVRQACFAPDGDIDVAGFGARAREVVTAWH